MPRKKGQGVMDKVTRLNLVIEQAQRELAQIEVRETFDQMLNDPTPDRAERFKESLDEYLRMNGKGVMGIGELPPSLRETDPLEAHLHTPDLTPPILKPATKGGK